MVIIRTVMVSVACVVMVVVQIPVMIVVVMTMVVMMMVVVVLVYGMVSAMEYVIHVGPCGESVAELDAGRDEIIIAPIGDLPIQS
jgi:hypothetical protein